MLSDFYISKLSSLNVDRSSGHPKPHKVCLLLAIIDLIEDGRLLSNQIKLDRNLKEEFSKHFEVLHKGNDANKILLPYWHMRSEVFWHFQIRPGKESDFTTLRERGSPKSESALADTIEFAYLDEPLFSALQKPEARQNARAALIANLEDLSTQFHRWLLAVGKSEKSAKNYVGAVKGSLSTWASDAHLSDHNLIAIHSHSEINRIAEGLTSYNVFQERDTKGKRMYSSAMNAYKEFLADLCQVEVTEDIQAIIADPELDQTQKVSLVNTRIGQGRFRENLIQYWQGCAVTGYQQYDLLMASHIKPWRDSTNSERLSHFNGILLLPNLDKAFDKGYISFGDDGVIQISDFIDSPETLGINATLNIHLAEQHRDFLAFHRKEVFRNH